MDLPWLIHADEPLWVPPIKNQERELLTPGAHPFWDTARRELFLALRDGRPVGRIAAIVDDKYNAYAGEACGVFGFFECRNDREAAHALLGAARRKLAQEGMTFMRGPLNPSMNYICGLLVDGFELPPVIMMPWNPPYYADCWKAGICARRQDSFFLSHRARAFLPSGLAQRRGGPAERAGPLYLSDFQQGHVGCGYPHYARHLP